MSDVQSECSSQINEDRRYNKKMKFSMNENDIQNIWDSVSEYVESNLLKQKGVNITNFGQFSFNQVKLDVGQNKYVLIQRPLFVLSEKICQTHGLKQQKVPITGSVPVVTLNYSALMIQSQYTRDQIETCVRELITATNQAIANQSGNTEFVFTRIGRLQIRNQNVKFKFYKNFINSFDSSGSAMKIMQNRPGTADSVMSERPATNRSFTNIIPLPKISSRLPSINEQEIFNNSSSLQNNTDVLNLELENSENSPANDLKLSLDETNQKNYGATEISTTSNIPIEDVGCSGAATNIIQGDECLGNEENADVDADANVDVYDATVTAKDVDDFLLNKPVTENEADVTCHMTVEEGQDQVETTTILPTPKAPSRNSLITASSNSGTKRNKTNYHCSGNNSKRPSSAASSTCSSLACGHSAGGAMGQDLCYVCYQRDYRNVPVCLSELEKAKEQEENRVLQTYQNIRDKQHLAKENERLLQKRNESQKAAAYNLGISEAKKSQQNYKDPNMYRSYIFEYRPLTPPKFIKQNQLNNELAKQVEEKSTKKIRSKEDDMFIERLEQMQLADDLAKQREQFLNNRVKQKDLYKRALDTQVNTKGSELPKYEPDSADPFFGKNDVTKEKLMEKRQKAQEILKAQLEDAEEKKRMELMKKLEEQNHEEKVLDRVKKDLLVDRAKRYERSLQNRQVLENEWQAANQEKKERDMVERLKLSMGNELLLHEQCDKYRRCRQCKRKMANMGASNIWKETYYIPGSRYIY